MVRTRESQPEQLAGAGMAGRGPAGIGYGLATGEGRWRGSALTSGLAAALAAVLLSGAGASRGAGARERAPGTGPLGAALMATMALAAALTLGGGDARAQDATWRGNFIGDFNAPPDWSTEAVPTGTAFFDPFGTPTVGFSGNTTIGGWTFNAGAKNYTFINAHTLQFNGAGIVVNSGSATITNSGVLEFIATSTAGSATITNNQFLFFNNDSTAGSATISNSGLLRFTNTSTAGSATITNDDVLQFRDASSAGSATITNDDLLRFENNSTAGSATITNNSEVQFFATSSAGSATITTNNGNVNFLNTSTAGSATITNNNSLRFFDTSTAGSATIVTNNGATSFFFNDSTGGLARLITNAGGAVDISELTAAGLTTGSIAGAGNYFLGAKMLTVGGNDLSTEVGGIIQDGGVFGGVGGSLTKAGMGTLTLSGVNTYTGATTVDAGTLIVNGSIAASSLTTVNAGATLGGTGTTGNVTIAADAILAPGSSIGTLAVDGDATFDPDAFFDVEIDDATVDRVDVTGTATLAGTVRVSLVGGFVTNEAYTILTAGLLDGTFDALDFDIGGDFLFLTPTLSYNPTTTVFLTIEQASFATGGTTPNQMAVGGAIDQLGAGNPIYDEFLLATDPDWVQMTLDALSGEQHAATGGALLASGGAFLDLIADRFYVAFGGGPGALGYADDAPSSALAALGYQAGGAPTPSGRAFWIAGLGAKDFVASDGNGAAVDTHSGGIAGGIDGAFGAGRAGLAFGYGREAVRVPDRSSSADVDSARIGAWYAGGDGPFTYGVAASYAHHWIATERAVMGDTASADYTAHQASLLAEAGYDAVHGDVVFRPIAALRGGWLSTGAFAETGAGAANLSSSGETYTALDGIVGVKVSATRGGFAHWVRVAWEHAFLDTAPTADLSLGGVAFTVAGAAHPRDRIVVDLGVEADIGPRARAGIAYAAAIAHGYSGHQGRATVAVDF